MPSTEWPKQGGKQRGVSCCTTTSLLHRCRHLWKEDGSDGAEEGLEQRCAKSQEVTETCLMLLRSHLENAATAQQYRLLKGDSET